MFSISTALLCASDRSLFVGGDTRTKAITAKPHMTRLRGSETFHWPQGRHLCMFGYGMESYFPEHVYTCLFVQCCCFVFLFHFYPFGKVGQRHAGTRKTKLPFITSNDFSLVFPTPVCRWSILECQSITKEIIKFKFKFHLKEYLIILSEVSFSFCGLTFLLSAKKHPK